MAKKTRRTAVEMMAAGKKVRALVAAGTSVLQATKQVGIGRKTFLDWAKRNPEESAATKPRGPYKKTRKKRQKYEAMTITASKPQAAGRLVMLVGTPEDISAALAGGLGGAL